VREKRWENSFLFNDWVVGKAKRPKSPWIFNPQEIWKFSPQADLRDKLR